MDLSLHNHRDIDNLVDVWNLQDLDMLGHLVDQLDHRHVLNFADELRQRGFSRLGHSPKLRDLSLHHHRDIDNFVDLWNLRDLDMLGHLVDLPDHRHVHNFADELRQRGLPPSSAQSENEGPVVASPQGHRQPRRCIESAGS